MRQMKDSGIAWVGEIPQDWEKRRTKYCFASTKEIAGVRADDYERLALTMNGVIKRSKDDNTGLQPEKFETYQILRPNELVFKLIDLQNVSTSRVGLSPFLGLVSPAYIILKPSNGKVLPRFAEKYFLMLWKNQIFNALGDAGVRSSLNITDLLEIPLVSPSIDEQQRITNFLDKECEKIEELKANIQAQIDTLEQYKRSVITEAVTRGLDRTIDLVDSQIEYIKQFPSTWTLRRLKYILSERVERSVSGTEMLLSVSLYKGVIPSAENNNRTMKADSLIGYKKVYKGDLVFNKLNPGMARFGCSKYNGITSPDFAVYIVNNKYCDANFLHYLLKTDYYICKIKSVSMGVADGFARLYSSQLYEFYVALPPRETVDAIVEYLNLKCEKIEKAISEKQSQLDILDEYKKSLIYEYVTGKKGVI